MARHSITLWIVAFVSLLSAQVGLADDVWQMPLMAGQHYEAGVVTIVDEADRLFITVEANEDWCLETIHLYVSNQEPAHHAPGRFPYKHANLGCAAVDTFDVSGITGEVYVAVHADVYRATTSSTDVRLNDLIAYQGVVSQTVQYPGGDSYFNTTLSGSINGTFDGWCVDTQNTIASGFDYTGYLWSTYDPDLPGYLVDKPENLDLVNYILNQQYTANGYTFGDVQRAIWTLIDNDNSTSSLGDWSQQRTDQIIADAMVNGQNYMPACGDFMALIVQPVDETRTTNAQITIIAFEVPCTRQRTGRGETAWALSADGERFRRSWGGYLQITVD